MRDGGSGKLIWSAKNWGSDIFHRVIGIVIITIVIIIVIIIIIR